MAERIVYTIFGAFLVIAAIAINNHIPVIRADNTAPLAANDTASQPIKTDSQFTDKTVETSTAIPYKTIYKDDPETEAGTDTVLEEGVEGKKTIITKITYHEGTEYEREIVATETTDPKDKIISRGTKIVWRTLETADGEIRYWKKMRVWATHYDSHCPGCNEWTSIGMKQGKGVIAVDPKVIKYRTKLYVPGYGMAIAGDTGGAIKGNIIDLGFEDARTAGWHAQFVDIYLTN
ncbi:MAG: G5 domain-containing protein [Microgenomates group bacterium]|jgi:3D (Asp-Asp-Asp) domain-containing protein